DAQNATGDELGEMVAGRLSGDAGPGRQLSRRPRLAGRQSQADGGAGRIGQEIRHERDIGLRHRSPSIAPSGVPMFHRASNPNVSDGELAYPGARPESRG